LKIKYVCLSDMHLGQDNSLLTNLLVADSSLDNSSASPVLQSLCDGLRESIKNANVGTGDKPILILNGDTLELALADVNVASQVFLRFIECAMPPDNEIFSDIIYIPGNHDHHIWELARETQYIEYLKGRNDLTAKNAKIEAPWHTTNLIQDPEHPLSSYFLNGLVRHYNNLRTFNIKIAYPNLGISSNDGNNFVIFHHGHYVESIYMFMTEFMSWVFPGRGEPAEIWDIEKENFAWIDFFWSTMGRSGQAGSDVEVIYEALPVEKARNKLISNLCTSLTKMSNLPGWEEWIEGKFLEKFLNFLADHIINSERSQTAEVLSADARTGLWKYMEGPVLLQLLRTLRKNQNKPDDIKPDMPKDITFVFGHTHKPYQSDEDFKGYPVWVDVYNTGGWVVESVQRQPITGASVVLFDENLNSTSIRLYNEADDPTKYQVQVIQASKKGANPFHEFIKNLVMNTPVIEDKWKDFSKKVAQAVDIRAKHLKAKLARSED